MQWLSLQALMQGTGSIPDQGTKDPMYHMALPKIKLEKKENECG